jgi:hypothetical protein
VSAETSSAPVGFRARGSAVEARGPIETAVDLGYIKLDPIADDQLDHISAVMYAPQSYRATAVSRRGRIAPRS